MDLPRTIQSGSWECSRRSYLNTGPKGLLSKGTYGDYVSQPNHPWGSGTGVLEKYNQILSLPAGSTVR